MKNHSILLVDDEQENINLLSHILGEEHLLYKALDGAAALKLLEKHDVHLILTDQRMPDMDGVDLLEKARDLRPDTVRVLITAFPDAHNAIQAINRGQVKRYVAKPFDPAELRVIIAQELEHRDLVMTNRHLNEEMAWVIEELFRANRELRELNHLKDQFLANCSHELKTPLVSGIGYLDLLLSGGLGKLDKRQIKGIRTAHRNLERLLGLIENLLVLTKARFRPDAPKIASFKLAPLIKECVESLRARSNKKSLRILTRAPRNLPAVQADERKIHSVLTNVLANAEKFTPSEARIEIRVQPGADGKCRVTITDNGDGPEEPSYKIGLFKSTSDPRRAGLGIGLTLARQVLQEHGCDITLKRGRRGGGIVNFNLPLSKPTP